MSRERKRERGIYANVFYKPAEVAQILGVSLNTVYDLLRMPETTLQSACVDEKVERPRRLIYGAVLLRHLGIEDRLVVQTDAPSPGLFANVLYSVKQAAAVLGLNPRTVYRLVQDGKLGLATGKIAGSRGWRIYGAQLAECLGVPPDLVPIAPASVDDVE